MPPACLGAAPASSSTLDCCVLFGLFLPCLLIPLRADSLHRNPLYLVIDRGLKGILVGAVEDVGEQLRCRIEVLFGDRTRHPASDKSLDEVRAEIVGEGLG
jgi:hypothetical protein